MIRVFCDFDGTVAAQDVGNRLFQTFAGEQASLIVKRYRSGEINAVECLSQECAALGDVVPGVLETFVGQCDLDAFFLPFVAFCERHKIPVTILSDGLDFYVESLLKKHGLERLPWFANHAEFVSDDGVTKLKPSFPYRSEHCEQCGNCKRNHMLPSSADDDTLIYVGDGISDRCAVRYADVVFAKADLIRYCQSQNISFHEFRDFRDVKARMERILQQRRLTPRREARMARRDAFIAE